MEKGLLRAFEDCFALGNRKTVTNLVGDTLIFIFLLFYSFVHYMGFLCYSVRVSLGVDNKNERKRKGRD